MKKIINKLYHDSIEYIVNWKKHIKEYAWAIVIVLIIRSSLGVIYRIPTSSMIPTFREGDILIGNRFYYGLKLPFTDEENGYRLPAIRKPEVGDVIIINGPREELFYDLIINYSPQNYSLLKQLNQASKFKGIIDKEKFPAFPNENNYSILEFSGDKAIVHLHHSIYERFKPVIEKEFKIIALEKRTTIMNYNFPLEKPWIKKYLSTPIAGVSIITTVVFNSPFFLFYQLIIRISILGFEKPISFYPNNFIDNTKEYVKRFVAQEGDVVEIKKKVLYINNQPANWSSNYKTDPYINSFKIYRETLLKSPKSSINAPFTHPLRIGSDSIKKRENFDTQLWPYEPETFYTANFRDNFGPITIPKNHIFVLGDNRDESFDSRYLGTVPKWAIKGSPYFIFYPWSRKGVIK